MKLMGGTAIILYHNTWSQDRSTLITVLGWLAAVKGGLCMLFPQLMAKTLSQLTQSKGFIYFLGVIFAFIALILYSLGYMA